MRKTFASNSIHRNATNSSGIVRAVCSVVLIFPLAAILPACFEELFEADSFEYVIFGDFYGECLGENCIDIYKIEDGKVFEDTLDRYPSASRLPHETEFVEVSNEAYDELVEIFSNIPANLFDEDDVVVGQPDAGDWGGFYLETRREGETRYWLIDKMHENLPSYLHSFADDLEGAIDIVEEG